MLIAVTFVKQDNAGREFYFSFYIYIFLINFLKKPLGIIWATVR